MKQSFLIFVLLFPLASFPSSLCEVHYKKSFNDHKLEHQFEVLPKNKIDDLFLDAEKTFNSNEKVEIYEKIYEELNKYFYTKTKELEAVVQAIPRHQSSFRLKEALLNQNKKEVLKEVTPYSNKVLTEIAKIMDKKGVPVRLVITSSTEAQVMPYRLVLDTSHESKLKSVNILKRYQARFKTNEVTFDLLDNIKNGSAGFSKAEIKRIDLGMSGIKNILNDDLITMVGKHEFKHAAFANMRATNRGSIFHPSYIATKESAISSVPNHYARYMSAEELYNFTNNMTWASERLKNIRNFHPQDYLSDFESINYYIKETTKIAEQTKEVSSSFVRVIENLEKDIRAGESFYLEVYSEGLRASRGLDDAYQIVLQKEDGVAMTYFINKEIRPSVSKILERRIELTSKYDKLIGEAGENTEKVQKLINEYMKEEGAGLEREFLQILNKIKEDQVVLNKVAAVVSHESVVLTQKTKILMDAAIRESKINPRFFEEEIWAKKFSEISLDYRKFGNIVKEDYKGFAGL